MKDNEMKNGKCSGSDTHSQTLRQVRVQSIAQTYLSMNTTRTGVWTTFLVLFELSVTCVPPNHFSHMCDLYLLLHTAQQFKNLKSEKINLKI